MVRVKEVLVVEGRYDKNTLSQIVDATIVCTDGFAIFRAPERQEMLRRLAARRGLIILTDSDGAGRVIRGFLNGIVDPKYVKNAYIPDVPGKERRKSAPGKEGKLGVEGMEPSVLLNALRAAGATLDGAAASRGGEITAAELYRLGLSGGDGSREKRRALQRALALPEGLSSRQLLQVLNVIVTRDELEELCKLSAVEQERQPEGAEQ